jgi:hypothetical protein
MKIKWFWHSVLSLICLNIVFSKGKAQETVAPLIENKASILNYPDTLNKKRFVPMFSTMSGIYVGAMVGLNFMWYSNYERSKFHWFNDNGEWQQVDKCGHAFSAYFESEWAAHFYRWAGVSRKKAAIYGPLSAFIYQGSIELLDGFSTKWGASYGDIISNTSGLALYGFQEYYWEEQRIRLKVSTHKPHFNDVQLQQRSNDLYGNTPIELLMKDYNAVSNWLSINPKSFLKNAKGLPAWLNISFGYSAENMYGGYSNVWIDKNGQSINRNDVTRYRQFFISPDVDLSRIKTNKRGLKLLLGALNIFKIPAPAIEFNTVGKTRLHWIYF